MRTLGPMELLIIVLMMGVFSLIFVIPFWKIFSKAGYPGIMALTMIVPGINLAMLFFLAYSPWPALHDRPQQPHEHPLSS